MKTVADLYVLESNGDSTDRRADMEKLLAEKGACVLGSGAFYVSGVKMPDHSTLMGLGDCSEVIIGK